MPSSVTSSVTQADALPSKETTARKEEGRTELHVQQGSSPPDYAGLATTLLNQDGRTPLVARFRALFTLKSLGTDAAVAIIARGFSDPSALLCHELAYVLGQMRNPTAIPHLNRVLEDRSLDPMVRHEAAEALGAIGQPESIPLLRQYAEDPVTAVAETCTLALDLIQYRMAQGGELEPTTASGHTVYTTVDPAPGLAEDLPVEQLEAILLDTGLSLFQRYRAMFTLRNRGDTASVLALAKGLRTDPSALFRHEVAYVFGQLQHPAAIPALKEVLARPHEEGMVRHECAEALGAIATEECVPALQAYLSDPVRVVRESCLVGLDMAEYEQSGEFQYAQPLSAPASQ